MASSDSGARRDAHHQAQNFSRGSWSSPFFASLLVPTGPLVALSSLARRLARGGAGVPGGVAPEGPGPGRGGGAARERRRRGVARARCGLVGLQAKNVDQDHACAKRLSLWSQT